MVESFNTREDNAHEGVSLHDELDALQASLEQHDDISDELRTLYADLLEQIRIDIAQPDLSLSAIAKIQDDLGQLQISGMEAYLDALEKKVQEINTEKFDELSVDEKRDYLTQLVPGARRELLIHRFAQQQKERVAQQVQEEIQGPVASFYDTVGLGNFVRYLGEKAT